MKKLVVPAVLFGILVLVVPVAVAQGQAQGGQLEEATNLYRQGQHLKAVAVLRDILLDPGATAWHPDAQYILGKSLMALGRLNEAAKAFGTVITNWPNYPDAADCHYQTGRILYFQGDYQDAVQALVRFMDKFPRSDLVPGAMYWTAESLYASAYLDEAKKMYSLLVQQYPESNRVEAARYKVSLIDLKKREQQLLDLLKWSHQENIRNLEDYQNREKTFEEALRSYQKRLYSLADDDFRQELISLQTQLEVVRKEKDQALESVNQLTARIKALQDEVLALKNDLAKAKETEAALRRELNRPLSEAIAELEKQKALLDAREAALDLKEKALLQAAE